MLCHERARSPAVKREKRDVCRVELKNIGALPLRPTHLYCVVRN
jgi:hypothetical protein